MQDVVKDILERCKDAAQTMVRDEAQAFLSDAAGFLERTKSDFQMWADQYAAGEIDRDDLDWLLDMKRDVAEMQALKREGIAKIRLEQLQNQMFDIVISTISTAV